MYDRAVISVLCLVGENLVSGEYFQILVRWHFLGLLVLYSIPVAALILFPLGNGIQFNKFHSFFGRIEWAFSFFRDGLITPILLVYVIYSSVLFVTQKRVDLFILIYLAFIGLTVWSYFNRRMRIRQFLNFVSVNAPLEPGVFFDLYFASVSGLQGCLPKTAMAIKLPVGYKSGREKVVIWPVIFGLFYTGIVARLVIKASRWKGKEFCSQVADRIATVWSAKAIQLSGSGLQITGLKHLEGIAGRTIFVCNHKSFLDFAIAPLVVGLANLNRTEPFRLRYIAARDHFYENQFLYRVVGLGKALEDVGAVFVDRKSRKEQAVNAVGAVIKAIVEDGADIVMYPQGTRAYGNVDVVGKRMDAGYYTTGSEKRLVEERGHLKKGVAHMAVDAAAQLSKAGILLNIVPMGLIGPGIVAPRGKLRIQKGVCLKVVIGDPVTLTSTDMGWSISGGEVSDQCLSSCESIVGKVYVVVDEMLKDVLNVHGELRKRLMLDIRKIMSEGEIEKFIQAINAWRFDEDLIFSIVDCIYALPAGMWATNLRRLYQLLVETDTPRGDIVAFKKNVVGEMIKYR